MGSVSSSVTVKHDHIMWCCLPHKYDEKIKGYVEHSMILSQQFDKDLVTFSFTSSTENDYCPPIVIIV